ncbi:MAG: hypothetical protein L0Y54_18665 [Sporichthyaceae bacterium]|nr:hypothetical protein [Sporichthyaceae bacterium]
MNLLTGDQFSDLFTTFDHTAWRLETRRAYNADSEAEPMRRWLAGEPRHVYDPFRGWLDMVRAAIAEGKRFARVRIVAEPPTTYQRFGAAGARFNVDAGEDIRYLAESRASELKLPREDFWLFDSIRIARLHFDEGDRLLGAEIVRDAEQVVAANWIRDVAWHHAVPYSNWIQLEGAGEHR